MTTYKGNAGHLMQHWTLCEILVTANKHAAGLNFIDAHAMAPLATEKVGKPGRDKDYLFELAEGRLPNIGDLAVAYGQAWHQLTYGHCPPRKGYPNSAAFVEQVWKGDFSMLLCEKEHETCREIELWCKRVRESGRCKEANLFPGKWQERFKNELPSPTNARLEGRSLTLVSFDPNKCGHKNVGGDKWWNVYPKDAQLAVDAIGKLQGGILIQMSTYTANGGSRHEYVIASMKQVLATKDFRLLGVVRLDGHMMSMVYGRNVSWGAELASLGDRFEEWLSVFWPRPRWEVARLRLDWEKL